MPKDLFYVWNASLFDKVRLLAAAHAVGFAGTSKHTRIYFAPPQDRLEAAHRSGS